MDDAEKAGRAIERAIAAHIRKERLKLGWTLERLAQKTGLSKGYLSQIENSEKTPPIGTLTKIAYGLGLGVTELISGEPKAEERSRLSIVRNDQRQLMTHRVVPKGAFYDSFKFARPDRLMDSYIVTVSHEFPPQPLVHGGQEIGYTLSGKHEFFYDGRIHVLSTGDAVYFDSDRPHMSRSISAEPARVLVVFCNPAGRE